MTSKFNTNLELLNAKFEGYKLTPYSDMGQETRVNLDLQVFRDNKSNHRIGFRELQARIRHSHLFNGFPLDHNRGSAFVIDQDFNLHMIVYNKESKKTDIYMITQLIKPLGPIPEYTEPDDTVPIEPQLPSAVALSHDLVLVSNGVGDIELIGLEEKNGAMLGTSLASVCHLGTGKEGISPVPCILLTARQVKSKIIMVVYSHTATKTTEFNIATLEMDIPTKETERLEDGSYVLLLRTLHIQTGPEVPVYCVITPSGKNSILGSEARYTPVKKFVEEDVTPMEVVVEEQVKPAYQWSQDGSDVTVVFQLPVNTPKSSISCKFVIDHLSLLVTVNEELVVAYPYRKLWSTVRADECTWTYDTATSILTLFLTKADENTRWPQFFDLDDGVLENISSTALQEITKRLEKFSSEVPAQHPAATDMDEDIDEAGEPVLFQVISNSTGKVIDEFNTGANRWICQSYQNKHHLPSVCLSMNVDGLVFSLEEVGSTVQVTHEATLDAFAFVQASKRDARFVNHDPNLGFVSVIESSRNAYIYFHHSDKRTEEVQTLVDLTRGIADVIGVQQILPAVLMVLTERQLVILSW